MPVPFVSGTFCEELALRVLRTKGTRHLFTLLSRQESLLNEPPWRSPRFLNSTGARAQTAKQRPVERFLETCFIESVEAALDRRQTSFFPSTGTTTVLPAFPLRSLYL